MSYTPKTVAGVYHPMIADMYLKTSSAEKVLVMQTNRHFDNHGDHMDDEYYELLMDLNDIRSKAEQKVGHFDRIDIRTH